MFFKTIEEYKSYVTFNASFEFDAISPKLKALDRDILKHYFGADFIDGIQSDYDGASGVITGLPLATRNIIERFREITANISAAIYITEGQIQIDNAGIFIVSNENRKTAFQWQIHDLIKSYLKPGYQALEETIIYLQKNISDYSTYEGTEEFEYFKSCFIPTAKDFTKYYSPLNNSFMNLLRLRSCMDKIEEQEIQKVLLPDYYAELKTKLLDDSLSVADKAIIPYIRKAVANLTALKALSELNVTLDKDGFMVFDNTSGAGTGDTKKTALGEPLLRAQASLEKSGLSYLADLKKFMEDNKTSYTTYVSDSKYVADQSATVKNEDGQGYFLGM